MGIRNKLLIIIAGALLLSLFVNTYFQLNLYNQAFESELNKRITLLQQNLNQRALSEAQNLSSVIAEQLASFSLFSINELINEQVIQSEELHQAVLVSDEGRIFVHSNSPNLHQKPYTPNQASGSNNASLEIPEDIELIEITKPGNTDQLVQTVFEYKIPVEIGETRWGYLYLQYSLNKLNSLISQSIEDNKQLQQDQTRKATYFAMIILLVAFAMIAQLAEHIIAPITRLSVYAKEIARHNFTKVFDFHAKGSDEIAELSHNFVEMAKSLEENYLEQTHYNARLEEKVDERTKELHTKNEELVDAFKKVEESQQQLIYSEKMAALGQLVSGIAHEINTPLGAISASASNTTNNLENHLNQLKPILENSPDPVATTLNKVLSLITQQSEFDYEALSTREERQIKKELAQQLAAYQPDNAQQLAEMLLEMRLQHKLEALKPEIENPENNKVLALAHSLTGIQRNISTIHTAIARVSKVVFALKTFSHNDSGSDMIQSNINDGINTVLVLYQNQLRQGCEVHKELEELPAIYCFPDELNQVWTNLIHNALQAMQNHGRISIRSKQEQNNIVVEVNDNGPGIPKDIQHKVFSSLFTTKPAGEGSGLGLGICKKIIDKHQGSITLTSEPGNTTFTVLIPLKTSL